MSKYIIGVDVGGTNMRLGLRGAFSSRILQTTRIPTPQDYEEALRAIDSGIRNLASSVSESGDIGAIEEIGLALPGIINREAGCIDVVTTIRDWQSRPIRDDLARLTGKPVSLEHDAAAAARGEALFGAAKGAARFLYLTWGTGYSGAYVERGEESLSIRSIEPGHQILERDGLPCACGQHGCLIAYVGGRAVQHATGHPISESGPEEWDSFAKRIAQGLVNTLRHCPAPLVVFGGGVVHREPTVLERIRDALITYHTSLLPLPRIEIATLGDDSGVYGASALGLTHPL